MLMFIPVFPRKAEHYILSSNFMIILIYSFFIAKMGYIFLQTFDSFSFLFLNMMFVVVTSLLSYKKYFVKFHVYICLPTALPTCPGPHPGH